MFITSDLDKTYDTMHKTIVSYMMNMDIMNIRKTGTQIVMDCLIGNQEKIMIIIKSDEGLDTSVRGMKVDQVILVYEDDLLNVSKETLNRYLLPLTILNNSKDLDNIILLY